MLEKSFNLLKKVKRIFFPFYKNKDLKFVFKKLQEGFPNDTITARFVGGCVRKYLTNNEVDDIDIATILSSEEIKKRFEETKYRVIDTGIKHGTITLLYKNLKLEITSLRKDVKTDGRHAQVEHINDWSLDSERRDFTINAIYLDINGNIFDPQMGTVDLRNNNIKFIGDPQKRIEEDYLRIIRFIRFKIMYNSKVEITTNNAIKQNLNGIKKISKERILIELYKILDLENFVQLNKDTYLKEIFNLIFPEFINLDFLDRLEKIIDSSKKVDLKLLLAVLLIDNDSNHEYFSHKYNVSNDLKEELNLLATNFNLYKNDKELFNKDLSKNIYLMGKNHLINLNILNFVFNTKTSLKYFSENLRKILNSKSYQFHIDGKYLKENGMKEGKLIGKVLKKIESEWIANNFKISDSRVKEIIKLNS